MKVLFVTRKYPPSEGGMETAAYELHRALRSMHDVRIIAWSGSNRWLPVVYPWLLLRTLIHCWVTRPDVVYLQDGALAPIGAVVQALAGRRTVMTLHGLDVTYPNPVYQKLVIPLIARQSELVAVSSATQAVAGRATGRSDVRVINNGATSASKGPAAVRELQELIGAGTAGKPLIYLTGRLVPRKGITWFLRSVVPLVVASIPDVLCVVTGNGPEAPEVAQLARSSDLADNVRYLGRVSAQTRDSLYHAATLFVMPNTPQPGDLEGFGLVATEAAACGTPVIAAATGGITDAVIDGKNGRLVQPGDAVAFAKMITSEIREPSLDPTQIRAFTLARFSWTTAAELYSDIFAAADRIGASE